MCQKNTQDQSFRRTPYSKVRLLLERSLAGTQNQKQTNHHGNNIHNKTTNPESSLPSVPS